MYTTYFGFRDEPFSLTPASHFFYANAVYEEAYNKLLKGIYSRQGFMVLTGEVGAGKTTLLRRLMDTLAEDPAIHTIFSYYSTLSFEDLVSFICHDLGLTKNENRGAPEVQVFSAFLQARRQVGETTALLIDEAQDLREDVLERLFTFSEVQQAKGAPLQILFVGQYPELDDKLNRPKCRRLKQAIASRCQLIHLGTQEVSAFIHHRLRLVGYERQDLFSPGALRLITRYSRGNPRLINLLCDNALRATQAASQATVFAATIQKVARTLCLDDDLETQREEGLEKRSALAKMASPATDVSGLFLWGRRVALLVLVLGLSFFTLRGVREKNLSGEDSVRRNAQQRILGQTIFARIAAKHPDIRPLVWGLATETPALALLLPEREWRRLARDEQVALTLYMESLIPTVRANPEPYLEEFRLTPVYEIFRRKVAHLCADCWVIGSGEFSRSQAAAFFDRILVQGDSLWNKSLAGGQGSKASEFRAVR